jgi:hypothetical protein
MKPRPDPPWPFKREALAKAAAEGGEKTCPTCGASTRMIVYPSNEKNEEGYIRRKWCPSCWDKPEWEEYRGKPKQMTMEV